MLSPDNPRLLRICVFFILSQQQTSAGCKTDQRHTAKRFSCLNTSFLTATTFLFSRSALYVCFFMITYHMHACMRAFFHVPGDRDINEIRTRLPVCVCLFFCCQARTVVIKGLQGFPKSDIAAIFEEAVGTAPVEVNVIENPNRSRGTAFVKFDTPELAREVSGPGERGDEKLKSGKRETYVRSNAGAPITELSESKVVRSGARCRKSKRKQGRERWPRR